MKQVNAFVLTICALNIAACSSPAVQSKKQASTSVVSKPADSADSQESSENEDAPSSNNSANVSPDSPVNPVPSNSTPSFDVTKIVPSGNWVSKCRDIGGDDPLQQSHQALYSFVGDTLTKTTTYYDRVGCGANGAASFYLRDETIIKLGEESSIVKEARKIELKTSKTDIFSNHPEYIARVNQNGFLGNDMWDGQQRLFLGEQPAKEDILKFIDSKMCFGKYSKNMEQLVLVAIDLDSCLSPQK